MTEFTRRARVAALSALASAIMLGTGASAQDKVTLKIANFSAPGGYTNEHVLLTWLDKVVAESEGTLDYKHFPGGVLGRNPSEQLKIVRDGIADMAFVVPDYTPGAFTSWGVAGIPGLVKSPDEAARALQIALEDGLIEYPDGVRVLGVFSSAINGIHSDTPLTSLDDINGQRLRAVGKAQMEAVTKLGGAPVSNLRATEVAEAVSRGTVDAALMDYLALQTFRVEEVVTSHADLPMGAIGLIYPMNQTTWDNLPAPAKAAFEANGGATFSAFASAAMGQGADEVRTRLAERDGETFLEIDDAVLTEFQEKLGDIETVWIDGDPERQKVYDGFVKILRDLRSQG